MNIKLYFFFFFVCILSCSQERAEPTGEYFLVATEEERSYLIGCMPFVPSENPFRIKFTNGEVELKPAFIKKSSGSDFDKLLGFRSKYQFHDNKITISPTANNAEDIVFTVAFLSGDSLVLRNERGKLDYYKRVAVGSETRSASTIWKFEIEASKNISSCYSYQIVIDTTGILAMRSRQAEIQEEIDKETMAKLFERINSISNYGTSLDAVNEDDTRRVRLKAWTDSNSFFEISIDPVGCSYDTKRLILIFDDFVYNYSDQKKLVVR